MRRLVLGLLLLTAGVTRAEPAKPTLRATLSEVGQSGICLHGDHLYLTVHAKLTGELKGGFRYSKDIVGQCFDKKTGKLLWQVDLPGSHAGLVLESWHDATSLTPVSDDRHVYFHNLNGCLAAVAHDGKLAWKREWQAPDPDIKNSRMFLHDGTLVVAITSDNIAVPASRQHPELPFYQLRGIDPRSGQDLWVSPVLLHHATQYNFDIWKGKPVVVASMIDLSHWKFNQGQKGYLLSPTDGRPLHNFDIPAGSNPHQKNQLCSGKFLVSTNGGKKTQFRLIDPETGKTTKDFSIDKPDEYYKWTGEKYEIGDFVPKFTDGLLRGKAIPTPSTVHTVGEKVYFWRYDTNAIGCLDVTTGKSTFLEVPIQELDGKPCWDEKRFTFTRGILNSEGVVANSRVGTVRGVIRGGFGHTNPPWPVLRDNRLYWQGGAGLLYIIDTSKPFSPEVIAWRSIEADGRSWTFGEPAMDDEHIYIRSQREWVKIPR